MKSQANAVVLIKPVEIAGYTYGNTTKQQRLVTSMYYAEKRV